MGANDSAGEPHEHSLTLHSCGARYIGECLLKGVYPTLTLKQAAFKKPHISTYTYTENPGTKPRPQPDHQLTLHLACAEQVSGLARARAQTRTRTDRVTRFQLVICSRYERKPKRSVAGTTIKTAKVCCTESTETWIDHRSPVAGSRPGSRRVAKCSSNQFMTEIAKRK